jgi:hypothetical protein
MSEKVSCIAVMHTSFREVVALIKDDGEIPTDAWITACASVSGIYDVLFGAGWIADILKGDILNSTKVYLSKLSSWHRTLHLFLLIVSRGLSPSPNIHNKIFREIFTRFTSRKCRQSGKLLKRTRKEQLFKH